MHNPIIVVERSGNAKTGPVSATYAAQTTCPVSCPLLGHGCYTEKGKMRIHTTRLNRTRRTSQSIAQMESRAIDGLTGKFDLRVHVVGDCPDSASASLISGAMVRFEARSGRQAWTYTHAWRKVARKAWGTARVMASCDRPEDIPQAHKRGYATALVARKGSTLFDRLKRTGKRLGNLVPCPNQTHTSKPTCVDCRLCMRTDWLLKTRTTIAFLEH